jgi:hypothetical protein
MEPNIRLVDPNDLDALLAMMRNLRSEDYAAGQPPPAPEIRGFTQKLHFSEGFLDQRVICPKTHSSKPLRKKSPPNDIATLSPLIYHQLFGWGYQTLSRRPDPPSKEVRSRPFSQGGGSLERQFKNGDAVVR